jgi:hypothetical protein
VQNISASGNKTTSNIERALRPFAAFPDAIARCTGLNALDEWSAVEKLNVVSQRFQSLRRKTIDGLLNFSMH